MPVPLELLEGLTEGSKEGGTEGGGHTSAQGGISVTSCSSRQTQITVCHIAYANIPAENFGVKLPDRGVNMA